MKYEDVRRMYAAAGLYDIGAEEAKTIMGVNNINRIVNIIFFIVSPIIILTQNKKHLKCFFILKIQH